jgi:hypothetical protein
VGGCMSGCVGVWHFVVCRVAYDPLHWHVGPGSEQLEKIKDKDFVFTGYTYKRFHADEPGT